MIKVYFESGSHAEHVATFMTDQLYNTCIGALRAAAAAQNCYVTEREVANVDELISHLDDVVSELNLEAIDDEGIKEYAGWRQAQINSLNQIKLIIRP